MAEEAHQRREDHIDPTTGRDDAAIAERLVQRRRLPPSVRRHHRDRGAEAELEQLQRLPSIGPHHPDSPDADADLGTAADADGKAGQERALSDHDHAGHREHHRERFVVGAGDHRPDEHRVRDRHQRSPRLTFRLGVAGDEQHAEAAQHERYGGEELQPEDDVVHVGAAQLVGGDLRPRRDRTVDARGVLPGPFDPVHHRVVLAAEDVGRRYFVGIPADHLQSSVRRVHQHVGRGQRRHQDGRGDQTHAQPEESAHSRPPTVLQCSQRDPQADRPDGDRCPDHDRNDPLVGVQDSLRQIPGRQQTASGPQGDRDHRRAEGADDEAQRGCRDDAGESVAVITVPPDRPIIGRRSDDGRVLDGAHRCRNRCSRLLTAGRLRSSPVALVIMPRVVSARVTSANCRARCSCPAKSLAVAR